LLLLLVLYEKNARDGVENEDADDGVAEGRVAKRADFIELSSTASERENKNTFHFQPTPPLPLVCVLSTQTTSTNKSEK